MVRLPLLLLLLLWGVVCRGFPVTPEIQKEDEELVQKYLEKYYNLNERSQGGKQKRSVKDPVELLKQMQKFFGLKVTGKPDNETLKVMRQPRCGVPDVGLYTTMPGGPRWPKKHLTYRINNYTPDMSRLAVDTDIAKAFKLWSDVSSLKFTRIFRGEADIMIYFIRGAHGDNNPFDGPGDTLAHAFAPGPRIGGDVHFDEDETWTNKIVTRNSGKVNLYLASAHEFGHSLGLAHSSDIAALMYPIYNYNAEIQLGQDDINGIQDLYGPSHIPTRKNGLRAPEPCDSQITFDAITTLRGETIFFKDTFYVRVPRAYSIVEVNYINVFWPHLKSGLDAVYEFSYQDEIRFFKGSKYWAFQGLHGLHGYPKSIYSTFGFPQTVKQIDAATFDEDTGKTYFFVADKYWRYDERRQSMDIGYPKPITEGFPGIGKKVDAVFSKDGFFYFFYGTRQYQFNPKTKQVTILKINSWFNCRKY